MSKIKVVPNYKQKANDLVALQDIWFESGREFERQVCIEYFVTKLEQLKSVEGIGDKTFKRIMDFVNKEWA